MPRARQASKFTRGSASALSQRSNWRLEILSPVSPERTCKRAPTAGAHLPALARQTISSPCGSARAVPVAPVMYCARSTNNWRTASSSGSSSAERCSESPVVGWTGGLLPASGFAGGCEKSGSSDWGDPNIDQNLSRCKLRLAGEHARQPRSNQHRRG
jgi:hypothetical protein